MALASALTGLASSRRLRIRPAGDRRRSQSAVQERESSPVPLRSASNGLFRDRLLEMRIQYSLQDSYVLRLTVAAEPGAAAKP
jgi:hypothetical protein